MKQVGLVLCVIVSRREIVASFDRSYRCIIVTSKEVFISPYEEKPCTISLFGWDYTIVNDRKFSVGTVIFFHIKPAGSISSQSSNERPQPNEQAVFVLSGVGARKNTTATGRRIEASMLSQPYLYMNS